MKELNMANKRRTNNGGNGDNGGSPAKSTADRDRLIEVVNEVIVPRLEAFDLPAREAVAAALAPQSDDAVIWAATD